MTTSIIHSKKGLQKRKSWSAMMSPNNGQAFYYFTNATNSKRPVNAAAQLNASGGIDQMTFIIFQLANRS